MNGPVGFPDNWNLVRAKYLFRRMNRPARADDRVVTAFRDGVVTARTNRRVEGFTESVKEIGYQGVRRGDLVIHAMDGFAGAVGISDSDGKCSPVYSVCTPVGTDISSQYYAYLLRTFAQNGFISALARGIRERSTEFRYREFAALHLPVPPPSVQHAIANFLDRETTTLDELVGCKRRLVALLETLHRSIVVTGVTGGLACRSLRETGLNWLPRAPESWRVLPLKAVVAFEKGKRAQELTAEYCSVHPGEYPVYSGQTADDGVMGRIDSFEYDLDAAILTTTVGAKAMTSQLVSGRFSLSQNCVLMRRTRSGADLRFVNYQLMPLFDYERAGIPSHMQPSLRISDLRKYRIVLPLADEQDRIVGDLEKQCVDVRRAQEYVRKAIAKLQSYRFSLVAAAVTGQIDVRTYRPQGATALCQ